MYCIWQLKSKKPEHFCLFKKTMDKSSGEELNAENFLIMDNQYLSKECFSTSYLMDFRGDSHYDHQKLLLEKYVESQL